MGKKYLREALNKDPDNVNYQKAWRGLMKMEKVKKEASDAFSAGSFQEAIEKFQECLELDPLNKQFNSTILFNRSIAYTKLNMNDEAISDLNLAIEQNDEYVKAYVKRADIYLQQEKF